MSDLAIILLGSNISPLSNLASALSRLQEEFGSLTLSRLYESPPIKRSENENYFNIAVSFHTAYSASELKNTYLRSIEHELGRRRSSDKYASREIDLDVVLLGDQQINTATIVIPDPEILKYLHVALPVQDLLPDWTDPQTGETIVDIVERLQGSNSIIERSLSLLDKQN